MADINLRNPDNVPGPWFTDEDCIICGLCSEIAPENFRVSDDGTHNIVFKQPDSPAEIALAEEAMDACPVEAIGNDGSH